MKTKPQLIRFGIMVDQLQLKNWQLKTIERLQEVEGNELAVIFLPSNTPTYNASNLPIGFRFIERQLRKSSLLQSVKINDFFKTIPKEQLAITKKGYSTYVAEEGIDLIKSYNLDVILRFGFGIIRGEVLDIPTYGVWSFHHGNPELYRGGPPAFWEFFHENPTNGLILQKLTNELDAGVILRKAEIKRISHSFLAHNERLYAVGIDFPRWVADAIRNKQPDLFGHSLGKKGPIYKVPSNLKVIIFYLKLFRNKLAFHYWQLFQFEIWNIGVAPKDDLSKIVWAPKVNSFTYQADPFMDSEGTVYFECYDYKTGKGRIAKRKFQDSSWSDLETVLSTEVHYSYPFVWEKNGVKYCIPEQYQAANVCVYDIQNNQLISKKIVLKGEWVDATLHEHYGLFWLFCSPQEQSNEELHLFFSNSLLGEYTAHPLNPVKVDISGARPGGNLFIDEENRLIRPSQNSIKTYGGSISLNHITDLTTTTYKEETVGAITPNKESLYSSALHTLSFVNEQAILDGKTYRFVWAGFVRECKRKLGRLF